MNVYIIVEGNETELSVYPAWLSILAPQMQRIENASLVDENNYYLFSGNGIPSIFNHTANAIADINTINSSSSKGKYDFLIVCLDTEEETREYIEKKIQEKIDESKIKLNSRTQLLIFDQKVCMETWFLGNRKVFKSNPQGNKFLEYLHYYNVKIDNPENMGSIDEENFTRAQFHLRYLKRMLEERHIIYNKNDTSAVCSKEYLEELIKRYNETGHISTFGSWYEFVKNKLV